MTLAAAFGSRRLATLIVPLLLAIAPTPSWAQGELEVQRLREDVRALQRQMSGAGSGVTEDRFQQIERRLTMLTEQVEQLGRRVDVMQRDFETFKSDIEFRMGGAKPAGGPTGGPLGGPLGGAAPAPRPPGGPAPLGPTPTPLGQQAAAPASTLPPPTPAAPTASTAEKAYEDGFKALQAQDYPGAERAFRAVVQRYPQHQLAGSAQYWLGETYFARRDYANAATAFAEGYQKYKNSPKGPDNLLKLGMSLNLTNKPEQACAIYDRLGRDYPAANNVIKQRVAQERAKAKCA